MADVAGVDAVRIGPNTRLTATAGVASVELEGEVVVLDSAGQVHLLNPTAGLLWGCFDGEQSLEQIAADCAAAFGLPFEAMLRDVITFATEMVALGLVALRPS